MSSLNPTEVAASMQEQFAAQHARWSDLTSRTFENMMRLVDIGMKATKESMEESAAVAQQAIYATSPQDLLVLGADESRSSVERMMSVGGEFAGITSAIQGELGKLAQAEFTDGCQRMSMMVEGLSQNLPEESRSPYSIMKFAIENANSGYEQWVAMTRQMADATDSNLSMATGQYTASRRAGRAKKAGSRE